LGCPLCWEQNLFSPSTASFFLHHPYSFCFLSVRPPFSDPDGLSSGVLLPPLFHMGSPFPDLGPPCLGPFCSDQFWNHFSFMLRRINHLLAFSSRFASLRMSFALHLLKIRQIFAFTHNLFFGLPDSRPANPLFWRV